MKGERTALGFESAGALSAHPGLGARMRDRALELRAALRAACEQAWEEEQAWRRPILWAPIAAGAGALAALNADVEPALWALIPAFAAAAALTFILRARRASFALAFAFAAVLAGFLSMELRIVRVAAPVLTRPMVVSLTGFIEQIDHRREGARLLVRVVSMERTTPAQIPYRIRVTTRRPVDAPPGALVGLKARLLPPARAGAPGGYDFARDAFFARIGAVGNILGRIETRAGAEPPPLALRFWTTIDGFRNALTLRVAQKLEGDTGAIAAAMVAGKRDFLAPQTREIIREAGIFHIITISGVQMTLVAGIFFVGLRRLMALSPHLALHYPIKKWAAGLAMIGAIAYDLAAGSRVGTERALAMNLIFLGAAIADRAAISMRNLALAAWFIILFEPEALAGASFQLSFAAVAALIAVWEARAAAQARARLGDGCLHGGRWAAWRQWLSQARWHGFGGALFATFCATAATTAFMTANFHEFSPYVLIGNPLTLAMIEFFAVPAALLGTLLYPFGLDGPVWLYLGFGIDLVMRIAHILAALPAATIHIKDFAPWALPFLALAMLNCVIWRSNLFRLLAVPCLMIGLYGAFSGPSADILIAPTGESAAARGADGLLTLIGRKNDFIGAQWLRADADGRSPEQARGGACDRFGCAMVLRNGKRVVLVSDAQALIEDCGRADILIAKTFVPSDCAAQVVIDRRALLRDGAIALSFDNDKILRRAARAPGEDRPWSPAPKLRKERPDLARTFDRDADDSEAGQSFWDSLD